MIPGPIEFTPEVMRAMGMPTTSHVAPKFIEVFGQALERLGDVFLCPHGQPFVFAGSGSLAMDIGAANLVEPGDKGIVINTGYFSDRMGVICEGGGVRREAGRPQGHGRGPRGRVHRRGAGRERPRSSGCPG